MTRLLITKDLSYQPDGERRGVRCFEAVTDCGEHQDQPPANAWCAGTYTSVDKSVVEDRNRLCGLPAGVWQESWWRPHPKAHERLSRRFVKWEVKWERFMNGVEFALAQTVCAARGPGWGKLCKVLSKSGNHARKKQEVLTLCCLATRRTRAES